MTESIHLVIHGYDYEGSCVMSAHSSFMGAWEAARDYRRKNSYPWRPWQAAIHYAKQGFMRWESDSEFIGISTMTVQA